MLHLLAQGGGGDVPRQDAARDVGPQRGRFVVDALPTAAVDHVLGEQLHHVDARRAAEEARTAQPRVDFKENIAPCAAVVLHVDVGEADVADGLQKTLHFIVEQRVAAREDGGVVADALGIVVFEHRLAEAHRAHRSVRVGVAVEHTHGVVPAGDKLLKDELAAIVGAVHAVHHREVFLFGVEEKDLLLPLKVAAQVVERVGVFRLDDDGEVERQTVGDLDALVGRGDDGLGIVHAVLLAERVEPILGVEGLEQLLGDEAVRDQPLEVVIMAAEQTGIIV